MKKSLAALALGALILGACSDDDPTGTGGPGANEVWMQSSTFSPPSRTVSAGAQVTFTNKENLQHNVTSNTIPAAATAFSSANLNLDGTFAVTLTVPGTYNYHCTLHGTPTTGMRGTIVVN